MFAVYFDPLICHGWLGYLIVDCWGIVPFVAGALALVLGYARRQVAVRVGR